MSTLVQPNSLPQHPQMANVERQGRPTNSPSKNLLQNELQNLFGILGTNRIVKINKQTNIYTVKFILLLDFSNGCCTNFTC